MNIILIIMYFIFSPKDAGQLLLSDFIFLSYVLRSQFTFDPQSGRNPKWKVIISDKQQVVYI